MGLRCPRIFSDEPWELQFSAQVRPVYPIILYLSPRQKTRQTVHLEMVPGTDGSGGIGPKLYPGQMPGSYRCLGRYHDHRQPLVTVSDCRYLYVTSRGDLKTGARVARVHFLEETLC